MIVGIVGAGAMGSGIAQVAAQAGEQVKLYDSRPEALHKAENSLIKIAERQVEKKRWTAEESKAVLARMHYVTSLEEFHNCDLVIEAIVEDLTAKIALFQELETIISNHCILASNTSSLSIASLSKGRVNPDRVMGIHFFNPAPLMPLVEVIPSILTDQELLKNAAERISSWGKTVVKVKDTPGFIVNRIARPYYGEALRIYEENIGTIEQIDFIMRSKGFKMGPFELMDFIGNDINYAVSETVWTQFYFDPRYRPSLVQKRMVEAGLLGRKTGRGYYKYVDGEDHRKAVEVVNTHNEYIFERIFSMLVNEAFDAISMGIATEEEIDLAMTKGVNYPRGLFEWAKEYGVDKIYHNLQSLYDTYLEDRYRPSKALRSYATNGTY